MAGGGGKVLLARAPTGPPRPPGGEGRTTSRPASVDRVETALFGPGDPAFGHWAFHTASLEFRIQANQNESLRPAIEESDTRVLDIVVAVVEDGIESGAFREVEPVTSAKLLVGAIDAARTLGIVGVDETAPETFHEALAEFVPPRLYADE